MVDGGWLWGQGDMGSHMSLIMRHSSVLPWDCLLIISPSVHALISYTHTAGL